MFLRAPPPPTKCKAVSISISDQTSYLYANNNKEKKDYGRRKVMMRQRKTEKNVIVKEFMKYQEERQIINLVIQVTDLILAANSYCKIFCQHCKICC